MSKNNSVSLPDTLSFEKRETIKLTFLMSSSAFIGKIVAIPSGIITAQILGPSLLGILNIINLMIQYAGYTHLGLQQNLPRDVPIAYGKGDKKEAKLIMNTVFTGMSITCAFSVLALWILFLLGVNFKGALDFSILIIVTLILISNRADSFLRAYVKAEDKFMIIGKLELILAFIVPVLTIAAVIFFKLKGALFAIFLMHVISIGYYVVSLKKPKFQFYFNIRKTLTLLKTGFMVFINHIYESIFWSVDLIILAAMLTTADVGLYSVALAALAIADPFSRAITMKTYRKIMVDGGKYGVSSKKHFRKYTEGLFVCYLLFTSLIIGMSILGYMLAIRIVLTKYMESILIMIILGFGYMVFTSRTFPGFYLNVTNQLHKRLFIFLGGLGINAFLDYLLIRNGYGKEGAAFACSFSFLFIAVMIIGISFNQIYGTIRSALSFLFKLCATSAILTGILFAFYKWNVFDYTHIDGIYNKLFLATADFAIKGLIFGIVCCGAYFLFFKKYNPYGELKPIISYIWSTFRNGLKMRKNTTNSDII